MQVAFLFSNTLFLL